MPPLLWFLLGTGVGALALALALRRGGRPRADARPPAPPPESPPAPAPPPLEALAEGVSAELASLASGVEGNAQLLCEAIGVPDLIPPRAEQLWGAVRRLRALSEKIQFAIGSSVVRRSTLAVQDVLASVQHELDDWNYGRFQVEVDMADSALAVASDPHALRRALLLLVEVLFGKEPSAGRLSIRAGTNLDEDAQTVVIQLAVEVEEAMSAKAPSHAQIELAEAAARNLLAALDADWTIEHNPGMEVSAWIALPAAIEERPAAAEGPQPDADAHEFGGALVLESDPAVRFMVGQELERAGRQVFLCADGTAARALWRATPERFELLVVEPHGRRELGDELAADALAEAGVRVVLLGASDHPALNAALTAAQPRVAMVAKPFGVMELRDALALLGVAAEAAPR